MLQEQLPIRRVARQNTDCLDGCATAHRDHLAVAAARGWLERRQGLGDDTQGDCLVLRGTTGQA